MQQREERLDGTMLHGWIARYGFAVATVLLAFLLRTLLVKFTGAGAGFVLILAAMLFTSLVAGTGPAIFTLVISIPLAFGIMVMTRGYTGLSTAIPLLLYAVDGCVIVYVTNRMQRERRTLARTIELSADAYFLADRNAIVRVVNRAACELLGYDRHELVGMKVVDIIPDMNETLLTEVRGLLAKGKIRKEWVQRRKDGSMVPVEVTANLLADGRWQGFARDISDARRVAAERESLLAAERVAREQAETANAQLRVSEAKFSGIISIAADAIITVDPDQRITIFNEGAERIFGYSRDEIIGQTLDKLIPEKFHAIHAKHFKAFAADGQHSRTMADRREVFGRRKNGEEFPAEASISKVSVGDATLFSVVLRDVTYRKSVEEALRRAIAAREEVLGIVAHDLRNPLSTITMQLSAMERTGPEPERRNQRPLQVIMRSADRMNHLIRDLLDIAVLETGQLKVEREQISAADVAREAVETQAQLVSAAKLDIKLDLAADGREICGDRNRLLQVFENLIGNAIKFTKAGGHIIVHVKPADQAIEFAVEDTGTGIAPENLPRLFERFWQARASRQGAGLGLVITKGIVEAHGGRIWAESQLDRGTTFHFTIPCNAPDRNRPLRPRGPERRSRRMGGAVS